MGMRVDAGGGRVVAQTNMGMPAASITSMDSRGWSLAQRVRSSGTKKVMAPAMSIPTRKGLAMSVSNSP